MSGGGHRLAVGIIACACLIGASPTLARAGAPRAGELETCAEAVASTPESRESWGCFYDTARGTSDWSAAEAGLRAAMDDAAAALSDPQVDGYARLTLANLVAVRDTGEAIDIYQRAISQLERSDDRLALLFTLFNLAYAHRSVGEPARGAETLARAREVAEAFGDPKWIATATLESVRHELRTHGDLGHAAQLLDDCEPVLFPDGDYQAQVNWLQTASSVARRLGQATQALTYAERLVDVAADASDRYVEATARHNALDLRLQLEHGEGDRPASAATVTAVREAIELGDLANNDYAAAALRCMLSFVLLSRDQTEAADRAADACLAAAEGLDDPRVETDALLVKARVLLARGRLPSAAELAELAELLARAAALTEASDDLEQRINVDSFAAEFHWRAGDRDAAIAAAETAIGRLDELRALQTDPLSRAQFLARRASIYERHVDLLLTAATTREDDPRERAALLEAAFETMERFRARVLRESLDTGVGPGQAATRPPSLATFQATLEPDEAVLAYQLAPVELTAAPTSGSWVLVITRDELLAHPLPPVAELEAALAMFGPSLAAGQERGLDAAARALAAPLVRAPLSALARSPARLTLLLDDDLHGLPFAALRDPDSGELLISHLDLAVAPSAALLARLRRAPTQVEAEAVLVLADPSLPPSAGADPRLASLAALPYARREAQRVAHGPADQRWLGSDASESRLARAPLDAFAVLHFATHALVDGVEPERSAIVLSAGEADGLLEARELASLALDGKLVVLSACSSATGQQLTGEGVMGLAHALFEAGAVAVVGSLWPTRDDDALALSERLYHHLDAGESVAAALAAAQRELASEGRPSAGWASMVVLGDGAHVPFPAGRAPTLPSVAAPGRGRPWIVVGLLLALGLLLTLTLTLGARRAR